MVKEKRKVDKTKMNIEEVKRSKIEVRGFPDDVIFIILLCLPADVLYKVMRLVCKQWYDVIKSPVFINSHLQNLTTNSLLIHYKLMGIGYVIKPCSRGHNQVLEVKDVSSAFVERVSWSCNGLLYVIGPIERTSNCPSYVVNLVTKEYLPLPLFPKRLDRSKCCFGYVAASRVYKVMSHSDDQSRCLILSVGVDKAWRKVDISELSDTAKKLLKFGYHNCLTKRGFTYWFHRVIGKVEFPIILRFDMETEAFKEINIPPQLKDSYGLLAMENSVCLYLRDRNEKCAFDIWLLKDPENGHEEWEKVVYINVKDRSQLNIIHQVLLPLVWLKSRELMVFGSAEDIMVYNVNTGQKLYHTEMMKEKGVLSEHGFDFDVHVDSLVPLNNLSLVMTAGCPHKSPSKVYSKENMKAEFES